MKNDEFAKQVTSKLDRLAQNHRNKAVVMENVLNRVQDRSWSRYGLWKMTGFAAAAVIMGVVVVPNATEFNQKVNPQQVIVTPKLSPQMVEDMEMLSVFAEDKSTRGS
ncbi:hypothetical protein EC844_1397 [Acinetobacter calcoaceticus]|uniref:Uncharacterized protein n=1 Tax=Acinetobacter calcoaceticus TaxID=471 RepID=A0A4R1X8C2_ACICA|nr:hypothetical protein EC844_1397 [Acinetobacter calcoaceticus]